MCPQMVLPVITGGAKRLGEHEKACSGRGGLDLCQGGPVADPGHRSRYIHPNREEARGTPHPGGYPCHPAQDGTKGPGIPSGKTLLHVPCSARSGGPPLPHMGKARSLHLALYETEGFKKNFLEWSAQICRRSATTESIMEASRVL